MNTVRVGFYRAKLGDGKLLDNGIDLWTAIWNPQGWNKTAIRCSHAEIWIPRDFGGNFNEVYYYIESEKYAGTCYTSTMGQARNSKAKYNGVCVRPAAEVFPHPERYFITELNVHPQALQKAIAWADLEVANNRGYDTGDIAKYFLPVRTQNLDDHRFICSGFCWAFLCKIAFHWQAIDPKGYSTSSLCRLLEHRMITDLPSPFRLAIWCDQAGQKFFDLKTGKEITV